MGANHPLVDGLHVDLIISCAMAQHKAVVKWSLRNSRKYLGDTMQRNEITLSDLLEIISTGEDPLPKDSNPCVMVYEYDDDCTMYNENNWENCEILFSIGTSMYSPYVYLKDKYANASVVRIWAILGEPIRVMICPKD